MRLLGSRAMLKSFCLALTLDIDSIFYLGAITCFAYPSANRTLLLQERTGHLSAHPIETHVYPDQLLLFFVSFPQKRNGIVFSSGVNYLHRGGNIQSE